MSVEISDHDFILKHEIHQYCFNLNGQGFKFLVYSNQCINNKNKMIS